MRKAVIIFSSLVGVVFAFALMVSSVNARVIGARTPSLRFDSEAYHSESPLVVLTSFADSAKTSKDTVTAKRDSVQWKSNPEDSALVAQQLVVKRNTSPVANPIQEKSSPFFLKSPPTVQREVKLDSSGKFVTVRETFGGKDVRLPQKIPIDEYIKQRSRQDFAKNFEVMMFKEDPNKKKRDDLGELLGSFTNIDIPVPANPVFSIFGPPRINLVISGAVDIRAAFRNTTTDQVVVSALGNSRNEPDFAQEVLINVNGTIGDKLNILADWNTQRTFEYENQLRIKYTGYEDELVQSVEAGNVSLATNSSFVSASSALFGIKAGFQIGPLKLTAIASQKKGQIQEKNISGGSSEIAFERRAWEYSKDYFFLDTVYISSFEKFWKTRTVQSATAPYQIKESEYEVWIQDKSNQIYNYPRKARAYISLPKLSRGIGNIVTDTLYSFLRDTTKTFTPIDGVIEEGSWIKLEADKDYKINNQAGFITLNRSIPEGFAIGIAYRTIGDGSGEFFYGTQAKDLNSNDLLILKLIKPANLRPSQSIAWSLQMRNVYSLGGRKISETGFSLNIEYRESGKEPDKNIATIPIIQLFGLDEYKGDGSSGPDGTFDFNAFTIDKDRGELIFPTLKPFADGITDAFIKEKITTVKDTVYRYDTLYTGLTINAQSNSLKDKFYITGKITAASSNTINLGFNVVENSVKVFLGDIVLINNVDYTVDYIIGQVIIKKQEALIPGAQLSVKFEQNDLFQLASKTLLGLRGEVDVSEKTKFGFTVMNLNQQTLSDKVRLNEEPINNTIYGFDGQTAGELNFLTKAIDALPFIDTKAKSDFTLRGEAAYMNPDPNTKKSPIPIDDNKGIAYIDDFEGAKRVISLGVGYGQWHDMSVPAYQANVDTSLKKTIPLDLKMRSKARTYWYNPPNQISIHSIYGKDAKGEFIKRVARGSDLVTPLIVNYNAKQRGVYNYSPDLKNSLLTTSKKNWGGIMKPISNSAINLHSENIAFIEVWVKILRGKIDSTRKIYIDLGTISEDVIPNKKLDTEDGNGITKTDPNGILNEGEDRGIDSKTDDEERQTYRAFIDSNKISFPDLENDPAGDNFVYDETRTNFIKINGTDNNKTSELGRFPDTEDLNRNNNSDKLNDYFEYELNLDTTKDANGIFKNPQVAGGGNDGWYQYRIPIVSFKDSIGNPDFSAIEFARLWFTGYEEEFEASFYDFNLIGNQWEEQKKNDPKFQISVVNIEDNYIQGYREPPGVIREQDRSKPDEKVLGNEQSLALNFEGLNDGESRQAVKRFSYKPLEINYYREMKMFVHGDNSMAANATQTNAKLFIRFGSDSLNYYEYKAPVYPGWDPRNDVRIIFNDITSLKSGRDSITYVVTRKVPNGPDSATYSVLGNPTLTRIAFISVGVENPTTTGDGKSISGQIWVNELRLADVDDTPGWAYSFSTSVRLADLGSIAFSYSEQDPFFHRLEDRLGSRNTTKSWSVTSSVSVDRFFPQEWQGTSLPFSYSHSEQMVKPLYYPGSDIIVAKAAEQQNAIIPQKKLQLAAVNQEIASYKFNPRDDSTEYKRLLNKKKTIEDVINNPVTPEQIVFESQTLTISDSYAMPAFRVSIPSENWFFRDIFNKLNYGFSYSTSSQRSQTTQYRNSWQWNARIAYAYSFSADNYLEPFDMFSDLFLLNEFKDTQIFYNPITTISGGISMVRSQSEERFRNQEKENPKVRGLSASRNMSFSWKLTENGLLNLSGDYSVDIASTLVHLELNKYGQQRTFTSILEQLFNKDQLISFGYDNSYNQSFSVNTKPHIPNIFDINKYITLSARYNVSYGWSNNLQQGNLGIGTRWGNNISFGSDLSLKQFVETWWSAKNGESDATSQHGIPIPRGRGNRDDEESEAPKSEMPKTDTVQVENSDSIKVGNLDSTLVVKSKPKPKFNKESLIEIARLLIKTPLLDYDKINISFTQTNSSSNSGVPGRPGFANFFGRVPGVQKADPAFGPSRAYQLGLVSIPSANITGVKISGKFPFFFFGTDEEKQIRAANGTLGDAFSQNNKVTLRTSRDLWTGAKIDLNWNIGWDYSRTQNLSTDAQGRVTLVSAATGGSIERSFFTMPPTFIFSVFKSGIEQVGIKYKALVPTKDTPGQDQKLSQAFEEGFESLPILKKIFGQYLPRVNYTLRWDGLEQMSLFKSFATRVSLDHAYNSNYRRGFRTDGTTGQELTESQRISYAFAPLVGLNVAFKEVLKGTMSMTGRYSSNVSYDLTPTAKQIVEGASQEMSLTASFGRTGFEIPLFGVTLQNDIDLSFSYSYSKNTRVTYEAKAEIFNTKGTPGEGSSTTSMEPRVRYVLSSRVTASLFYRYRKIAPDEGGSKIPGSTTNEGGVDVHISIQ